MRQSAKLHVRGLGSLLLSSSRQESGVLADSSGRLSEIQPAFNCISGRLLHRAATLTDWSQQAQGRPFWEESTAACKAGQLQAVRTKLTVKTTTKSHRFSHHIKIDRELELRRYWGETRGVSNPAFLQRYINFSRIYARFRDMDYLEYTMRDWDAAIDRLFVHDRGMQPANDLVRKHPYLLNVKILPLQFAKNAVKGKLPLYDWRLVLRDLRLLVGQEVEERSHKQTASQQLPLGSGPFNHATRVSAAINQGTGQ